MSDPKAVQKPEAMRGQSILLRLWWMAFGNAVLFLGAIYVMKRREEFLCAADAVFAFGVVSLLVARYVDLRFYGGRTSVYEPAPPGLWKRYAAQVMLISAALWIGAHVVSHLRLLAL